jgi:hypothetical protein
MNNPQMHLTVGQTFEVIDSLIRDGGAIPLPPELDAEWKEAIPTFVGVGGSHAKAVLMALHSLIKDSFVLTVDPIDKQIIESSAVVIENKGGNLASMLVLIGRLLLALDYPFWIIFAAYRFNGPYQHGYFRIEVEGEHIAPCFFFVTFVTAILLLIARLWSTRHRGA